MPFFLVVRHFNFACSCEFANSPRSFTDVKFYSSETTIYRALHRPLSQMKIRVSKTHSCTEDVMCEKLYTTSKLTVALFACFSAVSIF